MRASYVAPFAEVVGMQAQHGTGAAAAVCLQSAGWLGPSLGHTAEASQAYISAGCKLSVAAAAALHWFSTTCECACTSCFPPSLSLSLLQLLPYELDEASGWGLDLEALTRQVHAARSEGYAVR